MLWFNKKDETSDMLVGELAKLCYTLEQLEDVCSISPVSMRAQGYHPETGGTSVVYFKEGYRIRTKQEVKNFLVCVFGNEEHETVKDFVDRIKKKVVNAYCCVISIEGHDADGDSLKYEFKFKSQKEFLNVLENGMFSIEEMKAQEEYKVLF